MSFGWDHPLQHHQKMSLARMTLSDMIAAKASPSGFKTIVRAKGSALAFMIE
jgi:hypothetical protein